MTYYHVEAVGEREREREREIEGGKEREIRRGRRLAVFLRPGVLPPSSEFNLPAFTDPSAAGCSTASRPGLWQPGHEPGCGRLPNRLERLEPLHDPRAEISCADAAGLPDNSIHRYRDGRRFKFGRARPRGWRHTRQAWNFVAAGGAVAGRADASSESESARAPCRCTDGCNLWFPPLIAAPLRI